MTSNAMVKNGKPQILNPFGLDFWGFDRLKLNQRYLARAIRRIFVKRLSIVKIQFLKNEVK